MWQHFILYKLSKKLRAMNCLFLQEFRFPFTRLEAGVRNTEIRSARALPPQSLSFSSLCPPQSRLPKGIARGAPRGHQRREIWGASQGKLGNHETLEYIFIYFCIFPKRQLMVEPVCSIYDCTLGWSIPNCQEQTSEQLFIAYLLRRRHEDLGITEWVNYL